MTLLRMDTPPKNYFPLATHDSPFFSGHKKSSHPLWGSCLYLGMCGYSYAAGGMSALCDSCLMAQCIEARGIPFSLQKALRLIPDAL